MACNALAAQLATNGMPADASAPRGMVVHALNGFFVVASYFNITQPMAADKATANTNTQQYLQDWLAAVEVHCALPWDEASAAHHARENRMMYCFRGVYVLHLLLQGLQVSEANLVLGACCC